MLFVRGFEGVLVLSAMFSLEANKILGRSDQHRPTGHFVAERAARGQCI